MNSSPPPSLRPPPIRLDTPIPNALWFKGLRGQPVIYQGSATDMVRAMAQEMGDDVSPHDCIDFLCSHLARAGRLSIRVPDGPIEFRSNLFIRSLLATGIALPVPSA